MIRSRWARPATGGGLVDHERGGRGLEGQDLDLVLRHLAAERPPVEDRASAARRPLLAGAEVVDVAEDDVAHRRTVGDREREREERGCPASRSASRRSGRPRPRPAVAPAVADCSPSSSSETSVRRLALAGRSRSMTTASTAASIAGRVVAAPSGADARLALGPAGQRVASTGARPRRLRGRAHQGRHAPDGRAGPRAAWGRSRSTSAARTSPRRATAKTSSMRVGRSRTRRPPRPDPRGRRRRASRACRRCPRGRGDRRAARRAGPTHPSTSRPARAYCTTAARSCGRVELGEGALRTVRGAVAREARVAREDAVGREDRRGLDPVDDEHDRHPRRLGALLRGVGERRLVAVVTVGDQQLTSANAARTRSAASSIRQSRAPSTARSGGRSGARTGGPS